MGDARIGQQSRFHLGRVQLATGDVDGVTDPATHEHAAFRDLHEIAGDEALAIEEQVRAYGGPRFQLTQQVMNRFAEAIEGAKVDVVPKVVIGGARGEDGGDGLGGSNNVLQALLALLLSDKMGVDVTPSGAANPDADALRQQIRSQISRKDETKG